MQIIQRMKERLHRNSFEILLAIIVLTYFGGTAFFLVMNARLSECEANSSMRLAALNSHAELLELYRHSLNCPSKISIEDKIEFSNAAGSEITYVVEIRVTFEATDKRQQVGEHFESFRSIFGAQLKEIESSSLSLSYRLYGIVGKSCPPVPRRMKRKPSATPTAVSRSASHSMIRA